MQAYRWDLNFTYMINSYDKMKPLYFKLYYIHTNQQYVKTAVIKNSVLILPGGREDLGQWYPALGVAVLPSLIHVLNWWNVSDVIIPMFALSFYSQEWWHQENSTNSEHMSMKVKQSNPQGRTSLT